MRRAPDRRWAPAESVPPVAAPVASRWFFALGALVALFGAPLLSTSLTSPAVYYQLGVTGAYEATVTKREPGERSVLSGRHRCDGWRYHVTWEGGAGEFKLCKTSDHGLRVGDSLTVGTGVFGDVAPEWKLGLEPATRDIGILVIVGYFGWAAVRLMWYLRKLWRGQAYGIRLTGTVVEVAERSLTAHVSVDDGDGSPYRYRGRPLPAAPIGAGSQVRIWGCRTGWFTGRPKGPWAVSVSGRAPELCLVGRVRRR